MARKALGSRPRRKAAASRPDARLRVLRAAAAQPEAPSLDEVALRVARTVAEAEAPDSREAWAERFQRWISQGLFLPSVPVLANAGRMGQLAACFVLEPRDSLDSIYETLQRAARIQQGSGGAGIHFSRLRPRGAPIERTGGTSPGPLAFIELFARSARVNSLAGRRPGAHLAVLRDDHPDVLDFVRARSAGPSTEQELAGIGLALGISDGFLAAARSDEPLPLRDPRGKPAGALRARELLDAIAESIHATGDPTLLFLDPIEQANPTPQLGPIEATNPCGEQPLLPGESCVLGSLHLPAFADATGVLDTERLAACARDAIRFLDDVIEVNSFPDSNIAEATRRTRKVGLGIMGFADWLLLRGVPYGGSESLRLAEEVIALVKRCAGEASRQLAAERGAFPAQSPVERPRRNAALIAIAPTGTLRLIAGCSGGLEPFLQPVLQVRSRGEAGGQQGSQQAGGQQEGGQQVGRWVDRWVEAWLHTRARDPGAVLDALEQGCASSQLPGLAAAPAALLRRGWEVAAEEQIAVQARFQAGVDGAVSKTVHLPWETSPPRIAELIQLARTAGCKGVAFYRHDPNSKPPEVDLSSYCPTGACPETGAD